MSNGKLDALVRIGKLRPEPANRDEIEYLLASAKARLQDSQVSSLSIESRFDLAYNASHALALAALRINGYRSTNRFLVFQCLEQTLDMASEQWRVLDAAHSKRNNAEYEGVFDVNEELVAATIRTAEVMMAKLLA